MTIPFLIFLALAVVIFLLLLVGLFMKKEYNIQREITIDAPLSKVFDYLRHLKNQDYFNKWVMVDPNMKRTFKGTDGTVGFIYGWNGNKKAGEGELEIKAIEENKKIETEIRFVRPFASVAYANLVTELLPDNQAKVIWSNRSVMKYPLNIMLPTIEKMLAKDMDTSLANLK